MLSCSALSVIFLHNDTNEPLNFRIIAISDEGKREPMKESGVLAPGGVMEGIRYFSSIIDQVDIEVTQSGKSRSRTFKGNELPASLQSASSGGHWSFIKVGRSEFQIGVGSGNWLSDVQHKYGFVWIPCVGLSIILASIVLLVRQSKRRQRACE
jgi:hypothetical protein